MPSEKSNVFRASYIRSYMHKAMFHKGRSTRVSLSKDSPCQARMLAHTIGYFTPVTLVGAMLLFEGELRAVTAHADTVITTVIL